VLMADPDESLQRLYREPLLQEGFELVTAVSGYSALLGSASAHLTYSCSNRSCRGAAARGSCEHERGSSACERSVMVLTSCRDPRLMEAVARFPVSDYQLKPLAPDRLAERLRSILAHPNCVSLWRNKTAVWNVRLPGEPATVSGTCVSRPLTGESLCTAAPTRTTSSSWRWRRAGSV